ncbi:MAG: ABC transporter permease [Pseudomonadota bacterium]
MPSFLNFRVIFALMLREMTTRYGRSMGGYFWAVAEPVAMIALMSYIFSLALRSPDLGTNFPLFFATGFVAFNFFMDLANYASHAVNMNRPLLSYPRVTPMDAVLARTALQFVTLCVVSVLILTGIVVFYDLHTIYDFGVMIEAVALASMLGFGTGVTNSVIFTYFPTYENVWRIATRPLFLISGIIIIPEKMPGFIQDVLWYNPLVHAVGMMRQGFYPSYHADWISHLYIGGLGLGLTTIGLFLIYFHRNTIVEGR